MYEHSADRVLASFTACSRQGLIFTLGCAKCPMQVMERGGTPSDNDGVGLSAGRSHGISRPIFVPPPQS